MYSSYSEELRKNRVANALQRKLLNIAALATTVVAIGIMGWAGLDASYDVAGLALPEAPTLTR